MAQNRDEMEKVHQFLGGASQSEEVATKVKMMVHTGDWEGLQGYAQELGFPHELRAQALKSYVDPENVISNFVAFKNRCIAREELREKLESLHDGDYEGIVRIAQE